MIRLRSLILRSGAPAASAVLLVLCVACLGGGKQESKPSPPKKFAAPLFDGLWLGMTREEAVRAHPIRIALTSAGKDRQLWVYDSGDYGVELTFESSRPDAKLERVDVHFGRNDTSSRSTIDALAQKLGKPDVARQKAKTNAYGDHLHDQYDTVWSDADQYVFVTERVPIEGRSGPTIYYLTVKKKDLAATGPPTGYIPPPPPKGKDGKPVEEPAF